MAEASRARHADPAFVPSLRLLVQRERYSFTDIGLMFNVTRERVRQWCAKFGIAHPDGAHARGLNAYRFWNDSLNRFEPVPTAHVRRERIAKERRDRKSGRIERTARRRAKLIDAAIALKAQHGRDPSHQELAVACLGRPVQRHAAAPSLMAWWDSGATRLDRYGRRRLYADMKAALGAVGIRSRQPGAPGHVSGVKGEAHRGRASKGSAL